MEKMKSVGSLELPRPSQMDRKESVASNLNDPSAIPVYQDELALSRFLEEFLDYFVVEIFKQEQAMLQERNQS